MENLQQLFEGTLKDVYYAEKAILKALPKMAKKATSPKLRAAFEEHLEQTEEQVSRLEKIFEMMDKPARAKRCAAMDGITEEASEIMQEAEKGTVRDAGMLAAAQAVEHYEISRYGTLAAWAEKLGMDDAAALLHTTLQEEKDTDANLSQLAKSEINIDADEDDADEDGEMSDNDDDNKKMKKNKSDKPAKSSGPKKRMADHSRD